MHCRVFFEFYCTREISTKFKLPSQKARLQKFTIHTVSLIVIIVLFQSFNLKIIIVSFYHFNINNESYGFVKYLNIRSNIRTEKVELHEDLKLKRLKWFALRTINIVLTKTIQFYHSYNLLSS